MENQNAAPPGPSAASTGSAPCTCLDPYSFGHEPGCPLLEQLSAQRITRENVRQVAEMAALNAACQDLNEWCLRMRADVTEARRLINAAVEIMDHVQVGRWEGVRTWLESVDYDDLSNIDSANPR